MACTVTVDMSGLQTQLTDIANTLANINTSLATLAGATALGDLATLLTGSGSMGAAIVSAIVSGVLQTATSGSSPDVDALVALRQALVPDGFTLTLSERIAADKTPSVAQRFLQYLPAGGGGDPAFLNLGAIADRISPLPTDAQVAAVNLAWKTEPTTDNLADNIDSLQFGAQPYTP